MDARGYQVLTAAAPAEALHAYAREREEAGDGLLVREGAAGQVELAARAPAGAGAIDPYAVLPAARAALLPDAVTTALTRDFGGDAPLLFDAAETTAAAPEDGPYRDATYTALAAEPETLVTLVVALGDAHVEVHDASQTIATTPFSGRYAHFNPERDGDDAIARHREELASALDAGERLALSAGDVVLLAGGTVHRAPEGPTLVAHACPARVKPGWFAYRPERARYASIDGGRAWIASQHYDLVDAIEPENAPAPEAIEQVEEALRQHDRDLATDPSPSPTPTPDPAAGPRRAGGLVDSVRGMLGRRGRR
ncbi:MAG TPA: hypothetical protein VFG42_13385 [Baekduia sp.]|uniref:hypothetical protein n=1 Tax=Baekduia sp. TaxID=2600305 RepID=UPI002D79C9EF|nr:hypothetical protein [Baekduia sp.]HET6507777.1 hypothetical protein [Baekduia sp.]